MHKPIPEYREGRHC